MHRETDPVYAPISYTDLYIVQSKCAFVSALPEPDTRTVREESKGAERKPGIEH